MTSQTGIMSGDVLTESQQALHAGVFKHHEGVVTAVLREPARHDLDCTFATTTAFILGMDAGTSGRICARASGSGSSSDMTVTTTGPGRL
ncbi:hypothetical protein [Streptomyces sp. NBC_00887]|uniref:hypothetical protein n=1 Tax=Streptomyces sp. NBC_00887 TaxID=2975859 RepID=UPI003865E66C|nr:hypothetical protein OG844_01890 [Streptomyces sp. NBC_00887]WSY36109.1 hypothetical protein OG844_43710 [Streptomyces sp. NBC_00887]